MKSVAKHSWTVKDPGVQKDFDKLVGIVQQYLPQRKGMLLDNQQLAGILQEHRALSNIDFCIFGIIDYSTSLYIFLSDNVVYLDLEKDKAIELGMSYLGSAFHPQEIPVIIEKILPAALGFICSPNDAGHLKNAKATFTSRLRLQTGEYKWFIHQMTPLHNDEKNIPLLILKSMFEIQGIKSGNHLDLVLSCKNKAGIYSSIKEMRFPVPSGNALLSAREIEILQLISAGKASKEIAHDLKISINTVNNHRKNILRKQRSASMAAAIFNAAGDGQLTMVQ